MDNHKFKSIKVDCCGCVPTGLGESAKKDAIQH